ncbi:hypothetical protein A483_HHAL011936 [Halyomorpha halys]|nr:hypothetical protein A483_HHAL011936 [Halyomorpha halys]
MGFSPFGKRSMVSTLIFGDLLFNKDRKLGFFNSCTTLFLLFNSGKTLRILLAPFESRFM